MTRVKICGITRSEDAQVAVDAGADALGFVFYAPSPRAIDVDAAADVIAGLPAFVTTTALFVDPEPDLVERVIAATGVDLLQFHGNESPAFCDRFARPWIKALRMKPGLDLSATAAHYSGGRGILLDAYRPGVPGGTGDTFDWARIPEALRGQIILAGGLTPDNVGRAVRDVRPYAVDVSGGVEQSRGIKDPARVRAFIDAVRRADREDAPADR
jgi:phosphoribosylanthranilate isomerase